MEKIFAEIGFGNDTFLSTEIENGDREYRIPKFVKPKIIDSYYLRFWIFKTVIIISTNEGLKFKKRNRNDLKILFGISGTN
jgi:hypothetical protein